MTHTPAPAVPVPAVLNVEALALMLAHSDVHDWVYGEHWYGYPDPENDEEMTEVLHRALPDAREQARRYVDVLLDASLPEICCTPTGPAREPEPEEELEEEPGA